MPNNTTTNGSAAAGPTTKPGGAPQLPDAAPDAVQNLLDGIFSFTGEAGRQLGDIVSGLADAIGADGAGILIDGVVALL